MRKLFIALMVSALLMLATVGTAFARDGSGGVGGTTTNPLGSNDCAGAAGLSLHNPCP